MLRRNISFNYVGQLYSTLIGIVVLPLFLSRMGAEAFGLIGFYTLLQAWMNLLDMGMSPTLGREVARLKEHESERGRLMTVVNSLEKVFIVIALALGFGLFLSREWVATRWLTFEELPIQEVNTALAVMAITVAIRWVATLSRSGINAYEAQVWMNLTDILINTLRYPVALLVVIYADGSVLAYFYYQLGLVLIEISLIRTKFRRLLPQDESSEAGFSWTELVRVAPFALGIGYTGAIWIVLTQYDKLLLSKFLTLGEYGYFTLIGTVSSGLILLGGPIGKAVLPRMTVLLSANKEDAMLGIYRKASRLLASIIIPLALVISFYPEAVIYAWTGDLNAAHWTSRALPIFVLGSAVLSITAFQYYLQYAHGNLSYHVRWNTLSLLINIPLITYAAYFHGVIGVAWVWLGYRIFSMLVWVPYAHHKFAPGLHWPWLLRDIAPPGLVALLIVSLAAYFIELDLEMSRIILFGALAGLTLLSTALALIISMNGMVWRLRRGK